MLKKTLSSIEHIFQAGHKKTKPQRIVMIFKKFKILEPVFTNEQFNNLVKNVCLVNAGRKVFIIVIQDCNHLDQRKIKRC